MSRSAADHTLRSYRLPGLDFTGAMAQSQNASEMSQWIAMATEQKFAFFFSPIDILRRCTWNACPRVCPHPHRLERNLGHMPFRRSLLESGAFDAALLRLSETGLLSRLRQRRLPDRHLSSVRRCDLEARPRTVWSAIGLTESWPVFLVLFGGGAAALLLLLLEVVADRLSACSRPQL